MTNLIYLKSFFQVLIVLTRPARRMWWWPAARRRRGRSASRSREWPPPCKASTDDQKDSPFDLKNVKLADYILL
jgi:hypothetical protein